MFFGPASMDPEQSTAIPREKAQLQQAAAVQPCSSPQQGHLLFPILTREAQVLRPFQRQAKARERVCCFSLLVSFPHLLITKLLTRSESPNGNPPVLGRLLLLQEACP